MKIKHYLVLLVLLTISNLLHSQMIVRIDKVSHTQQNLLESLNLKLCFEMEEFIVVSVLSTDILIRNNIGFEILSNDLRLNPLYIVSERNAGLPPAPLREGGKQESLREGGNYIAGGEVVLNEANIRIERLNGSIDYLSLNASVKLIPVVVSDQIYRNTRILPPAPLREGGKHESLREGDISPMPLSYSGLSESILNSVNADSIAWFMQGLESFGSRFAMHSNRVEVSQWLYDQFKRFGFSDVVQDSFYVSGSVAQNTWQRNVIATLEGSVFPDRYVVIGAHYDSINQDGANSWNEIINKSLSFAPGSNDNASGVAAVLEIARVFKANNYQPLSSIRFTALAIEELGLYGAFYDAGSLKSANKNIAAMINSDMISYATSNNWSFQIFSYPSAEFLTNLAISSGVELGLHMFTSTDMLNRSDSWAYHSNGIPSIFFHIGDEDPNYHTSKDIFENQNMPYTEQYIKLITSFSMSVIEIPDYPNNFQVIDTGNGTSLFTEWDEVEIQGISYFLSVFNTATQETESFYPTDTFFLINDLNEGILYEISLYTVYDGRLSNGITRFATPLSIPLAVKDFSHTPLLDQIYFEWTENGELDIHGYKIYRRELDVVAGRMNESVTLVVGETSWTDLSTEDRKWYEYKITAIDNDGNESLGSNLLQTRHLSFNQGILLLDLTSNSPNNLLFPPFDQISAFYSNILSGFAYDELKYTNNRILIEDIGIYSTLIIHKNSFNYIIREELMNIIQLFIDYGGNIIFTANNPMYYMNLVEFYPSSFQSESFPTEYFKIESINSNWTARFVKGVSDSEWLNIPDLEVDISKIPDNLNDKLNRLEVFGGSNFQVLHRYSSGSDDDVESEFDGLPVTLYTQKDKSHIVLTSIPLYFIQENQAKEFIHALLKEFDYVYESEISQPVNKGLNLKNFPNPFNPITTIEFTLSKSEHVDISIFNIRGQLVYKFPSEKFLNGVNSIQWNGFDNQNVLQASGVYFYQVKTESGEKSIKRMLLLK